MYDYPGQLSFAMDVWTFPNHHAFVAWTVHLQYKGKPLVFLLDVVEVPESHSGNILAREFQKTLEQYGLTQKILAFTGDNATSNDTQTTSLSAANNSFHAKSHVRCLNHTINLAAKALIGGVTGNAKDKDADINMDDEEADGDGGDDELPELESVLDVELSESECEGDDEDEEDNEEESIDEVSALTDEEKAVFEREVKKTREALQKIRGLSFSVIHSTTIALPEWKRACGRHELKPCLLPRDVKTHWNSTFDLLKFALEYRAAVDDVTGNKDLAYRKYELTSKEWEILEDLKYVLEVFKRATLSFSDDHKSSISAVIPAMDKIDNMLSTQITSATPHGSTTSTGTRVIHASIKAGLRLAKNLMNHYYSLTDDSAIYCIAMARAVIKQASESTTENSTSQPLSSSNADVFDFMDISVTSHTSPLRDKLSKYLSQALEATKDPLGWWWSKRAIFPVLSQMALDYHSVPATSTPVERVFSQGRQLLVFTRNRLSGFSVRKLLCLGSWSRKDLVSDKVIVNAFVEEDERKSKKSVTAVYFMTVHRGVLYPRF
ncbi:hypothetical protein D9758_018909 [Tetrapyrgos nigripes]|uniref:HAT C-terminal dimerisation domain-containing protein n=1 Tax=Tetrapyrgos nigripes TaxID=182062 RepID=A0A8H5F1I0_9AGAR|nr:hypothetical protein D9758_018909 [Tetrapyrgos nigripes]